MAGLDSQYGERGKNHIERPSEGIGLFQRNRPPGQLPGHKFIHFGILGFRSDNFFFRIVVGRHPYRYNAECQSGRIFRISHVDHALAGRAQVYPQAVAAGQRQVMKVYGEFKIFEFTIKSLHANRDLIPHPGRDGRIMNPDIQGFFGSRGLHLKGKGYRGDSGRIVERFAHDVQTVEGADIDAHCFRL